MEHFSIVKAIGRAALADDNREVVAHQLARLEAALRSSGDADADALQKLIGASSRPRRAAPSRVARSAASVLERMVPGVPVPVDPESAAPLATIVFPEQNTASKPVFNDVVTEMVQSLTKEWEHQEQLLQAGLHPSLTALAYGPPGTGKTSLALWLAKELHLPAVVARLDGLISSLLGTTARNLGSLFAFANRYECVLILDEFDAIAKLRDDPNEVGEIKRVVNALLQNMDTRAATGITLGLTNHEALLDPAVWRRFEVQVPIPVPATPERAAIVDAALGDTAGIEAEAKLIVWMTEGFSGAEVTTVCQKWRKRRIVDGPARSDAVQLIMQVTASTAARFGAVDRAEWPNREALIADLVRSDSPRFNQAELAHLCGISTKTVSRLVSKIQNEDDDA
ncbi:AAA family ATPase [Curtobacterium flaccumfaciens]|uniref:AAA family ATPase n=1 Tax=Curtobacterium flaccumfaciens TaxID=2035 RepID=UPI00220AC968|nr:ATP-binding protein [Curtobacterium flaccumfaciens]UWD79259.1 ATP-binding protein [Curtobacterium flaccumfaciens]